MGQLNKTKKTVARPGIEFLLLGRSRKVAQDNYVIIIINIIIIIIIIIIP